MNAGTTVFYQRNGKNFVTTARLPPPSVSQPRTPFFPAVPFSPPSSKFLFFPSFRLLHLPHNLVFSSFLCLYDSSLYPPTTTTTAITVVYTAVFSIKLRISVPTLIVCLIFLTLHHIRSDYHTACLILHFCMVHLVFISLIYNANFCTTCHNALYQYPVNINFHLPHDLVVP